jgi:DNA-binding IclR family transcriptional regulator
MVGNSGKGPKKQDRPGTATDRVAELICAGIAGINIEELVEKTGYSKTKLYGIVHQLKKLGKIKNRSHGVYMKA